MNTISWNYNIREIADYTNYSLDSLSFSKYWNATILLSQNTGNEGTNPYHYFTLFTDITESNTNVFLFWEDFLFSPIPYCLCFTKNLFIQQMFIEHLLFSRHWIWSSLQKDIDDLSPFGVYSLVEERQVKHIDMEIKKSFQRVINTVKVKKLGAPKKNNKT